jgi:hypothetical protein
MIGEKMKVATSKALYSKNKNYNYLRMAPTIERVIL